jgi:hypothetical protein
MGSAAAAEPREIAEACERNADVPAGRYAEAFSGYGVMGLSFSSEHVLALRRFPATSVGPGYTSIWHRDPSGRWSFRQDAPSQMACPRYFSAAADEFVTANIDVAWTGPRAFEVRSGHLHWRVQLRATGVTRMMNVVAGRLPPRAWSDPRVLGAMARVAGAAMRVGHVGLHGVVPNGQSFQAHPLRVWMVEDSTATVDGRDLGRPGALAQQAHLGDFWIPQRGVFAFGRSFFEAFDPHRHVSVEGIG